MKKPLCIAIFGPLPSSKNVGGPETITYNLAKALSELGNQIYIFKGFFGNRINQNSTKVYDIIRSNAIKESQVFHVILGLKSGGYIGAFLAKALGKPLITHFHQPPDQSFRGIRNAKFTFLNFLSPLDKNLLKTSDKVISVSDYRHC